MAGEERCVGVGSLYMEAATCEVRFSIWGKTVMVIRALMTWEAIYELRSRESIMTCDAIW